MRKQLNFRGDIFGGITAGIVALPLALAFGVSSGLGPSAGLYGAIFLSFFAALLGGTNTQISGPTAPMTAVSMVVIAQVIAINEGDVERALPTILTVFLLAGIFQILIGFLGLGRYIKYIPYPVVSGFMTAIGVVIIITQILPLVGYYPKEDKQYVKEFYPKAKEVIINKILQEESRGEIADIQDYYKTLELAEKITDEDLYLEAKTIAANESAGVVGTIKMLPRVVEKINWLEFCLALGTVIVIYGFKRITTKVPSNLVALLLMSGITIGFNLDYRPIEEVPSGFPMPNFGIITKFDYTNVLPYVFTAITLSLLGAIDSLLTSVVADNMTKTKHRPSRELIGQGIGNSIAAIFGGIPGAGATIRTVVNIKAGGKTKLSGMISGLFLLFILVALGPVASKIPAAVLAGILITVGIGVMDYKGLKAIPSMPRDAQIGSVKFSMEVLIMFVVLLLSIFWNLLNAVGIGLVIASLMFMKKMGDLTINQSGVKQLKKVEADEKWMDEIKLPENIKEEVYIKRLDGPVFFGNTSEVKDLSSALSDKVKYLIIRMDKVPYLDQSGVFTFEEIFMEMVNNNVILLIVGLQEQPKYLIEKIRLIPNLVSRERVFDSFKDCLLWIQDKETNNR